MVVAGASVFHKHIFFFSSATHHILQDTLPHNVYYRFNPYLSEDLLLNEIRHEKILQMQNDADSYVRSNEKKVQDCVDQLKQPRGRLQYAHDEINHFRDTEPLSEVTKSVKEMQQSCKRLWYCNVSKVLNR